MRSGVTASWVIIFDVVKGTVTGAGCSMGSSASMSSDAK
eukprot:CAMPEP_0184354676 /NCGR_PEP_ID=MMETSP1089-20130417/90261_1 /TAXON_ID=38269 ORGANISM="Gloeochaete wittrockiana, Strain SAG46.84" /NCGR_SAMPLE_ID=MMETSP1089 /ASSEMBLY_ACC=CAM_ASM_000445 /LENGTH=38 /DNA_ID= /DNA_START= /DNA_END= /DNA_ORIENTATION=